MRMSIYKIWLGTGLLLLGFLFALPASATDPFCTGTVAVTVVPGLTTTPTSTTLTVSAPVTTSSACQASNAYQPTNIAIVLTPSNATCTSFSLGLNTMNITWSDSSSGTATPVDGGTIPFINPAAKFKIQSGKLMGKYLNLNAITSVISTAKLVACLTPLGPPVTSLDGAMEFTITNN